MAKHRHKKNDIIWEYQYAYMRWNYYARLRPAIRRGIRKLITAIRQK